LCIWFKQVGDWQSFCLHFADDLADWQVMLECQDLEHKPPEELVKSGLGVPAALDLLQAVVP